MHNKKSVQMLLKEMMSMKDFTKKPLLVSYISLFLTFSVLVTSVFSWMTVNDAASVDSELLTMNASSGLRVNEGESITNVISIDNVTLSEASSVDGRNIYFPVSYDYENDIDVENCVYYKNTNNWSVVYIYYWSGDNKNMLTWPGSPMEAIGGGVYSAEISTDAEYVVFNGGDDTNKTQNIELEGTGKIYDNGTWSEYTPSNRITNNINFREGTVGDKNNLYAYKNFTLYGDSAITYVYIKSYKITVGDQTFDGSTEIIYDEDENGNQIPKEQKKKEECPVRIAFIKDSSEEPVVIDPTALVQQYAEQYKAVGNTDLQGKPTLNQTNAGAFSQYYLLTAPIFTLYGTESLDVTMVVWLEGTGKNCNHYIGEDVSVEIELESNVTGYETITFVDDTRPDQAGGSSNWIGGNGNCIVTMCYKDINSDGAYKTVVMNQVNGSTTKWTAPIPANVVTDISFFRLGLSDEVIYNAWHTKEGVNGELNTSIKDDANWLIKGELQSSREKKNDEGKIIGNYLVYTAVRGNGYGYVPENDPDLEKKRLSPCIGYWGYNETTDDDNPDDDNTDIPVDDPNATYDINIEVAIPENLTNNWMRKDLESTGNYIMYANLSDDTAVELSYDNGVCKGSAELKYGTQILSFVMKNKHDSTHKPYIGVKEVFTVTQNYNVNYEIIDSGQKATYNN